MQKELVELEALCTETDLAPWRIVHVLHNHEKKIAQHMRESSIEHFLPLYTERSQWSDRSVRLERPLFPGYVFVRFDRESRQRVIRCAGVLRILGKEEGTAVENEEIDRIRTAISGGQTLRPHPPIRAGILVRVINGVFSGTQGVVTELRSNCKVVVSMAAVNQYYSLETRIWDLEVLDTKVIRPNDKHEFTAHYKLR